MMRKRPVKMLMMAIMAIVFAVAMPVGARQAVASEEGFAYPQEGQVFYGAQDIQVKVTPHHGSFVIYKVEKNGENISGVSLRGSTIYVGQFLEEYDSNSRYKEYTIDLGKLGVGNYKVTVTTWEYYNAGNFSSYSPGVSYSLNFTIKKASAVTSVVPKFFLYNKDESQSKVFFLQVKDGGFPKVEIYRATNKSGPYKLIKTTTKTECKVSTIAGKTNYFKIKGYAGKKATAWSKIVSVKPVATPAKITTLKAKKTDKGIELTWTKAARVTHVYAYRCDAKGNYAGAPNDTNGIAPFSGTKLVDKTVTKGKTYYYCLESIHWKHNTMLDYFHKGPKSNIVKIKY